MGRSVDKYNRKGVKTSYVSTIIGISLVLFVIGIVLGGVFGLDTIQRQAKESLVCDLFFTPEYGEADIKQIAQELSTWKEFREVSFVSPSRAIEAFTEEGQNADNILDIFEGENPLPPTISFKPKEAYATIDGLEGIKQQLIKAYGDKLEEVSYDKDSVDSVNLGFKQLVFLIGAVALLLIIVAFAMINNTIRLALYSRRFSIKTMQLVGATGRYIRKPFVWQAVGMGLIAGTIAMALLQVLVFAGNNVMDAIEISFPFYFYLVLWGALLLIGVIISVISTWFALNKYLRMKLDDLY